MRVNLIQRAADFLENWREDDREFPIPASEFGLDLARYVDILIDHARDTETGAK